MKLEKQKLASVTEKKGLPRTPKVGPGTGEIKKRQEAPRLSSVTKTDSCQAREKMPVKRGT